MNIIPEALDLMRSTGGFTKGVLYDDIAGTYCMNGALNKVSNKHRGRAFYFDYDYEFDHSYTWTEGKKSPLRTREYLDACAEVIEANYPERILPDPRWPNAMLCESTKIAFFNNHDDTTFEDIEFVMEKASLLYDEKKLKESFDV